MRVDILGVGIDTLNRKETLSKTLGYIKADERKCKLIATPNPEVIMRARADREFAKVLDKADLVIPDGVGVVWASKLGKERLRETVTGCDLCFQIFAQMKDMEGKKVYLLGAAPDVASLAKTNMEEEFPGLDICGVRNGFFDIDEEKDIVTEINNLRPDVLLVGLGSPRQEKWIDKYKEELDVNLAIGCGGTIDVMAGTVKRAPMMFQRLGLEWFYRLISQPSRFFRMLVLPKFVLVVICEKVFGKKKFKKD